MTISDQPYTTAFYHRGLRTMDTSLGTPNLTSSATKTYYINGVATVLNNDVPGAASQNDYRAWGNILRLSQDTDHGQARAGFWFESEDNMLYKTNILLTRDQFAYTTSRTGSRSRRLPTTTPPTTRHCRQSMPITGSRRISRCSPKARRAIPRRRWAWIFSADGVANAIRLLPRPELAARYAIPAESRTGAYDAAAGRLYIPYGRIVGRHEAAAPPRRLEPGSFGIAEFRLPSR